MDTQITTLDQAVNIALEKIPVIKTREEFLNALPKYMTAPNCRRWLLHINKVPHYANGKKRGKTDTQRDQRQLVSFDEVYTVLVTNGFTGLGFALGADGEKGYWQGIDLDDVWTNPSLISLQLPGYVEISPSGTGLHAIGFGQKFDTLKDKDSGIEAYCKGRYFTVTGNACNELFGFPVPTQPEDIANFVKQILSPILGETVIKPPKDVFKTPVIITPELLVNLKSALKFISADEGQTWIAIGYALRELGDDGYKLWAEWSATSPKHQGDIDLARWDGLKTERTGYAAVFALAKKNGWKHPGQIRPDPTVIFGGLKELPADCNSSQITSSFSGQFATHADWDFPEIIVEDVFTNYPKSPQFLIADIMPEGVITLISGNGGTGKSILALQTAIHLAEGRSFMGKAVRKSRVVFYSAEDAPHVIQHRFHKVCKYMELDPQTFVKNILFLDATENPSLYEETENNKKPSITFGYIKLQERFRAFNAEIIINDNASDTFNANENNRSHVRGFLHALKSFGTVLLLAHVDKNTARGDNNAEGYSGNTAWNNSVRSRLLLTAQNSQLLLTHQKSNYGKLSDVIKMNWSPDGVLINQTIEHTAIHEQATLISVISLIGQYYDRGDYISPARNARPNVFKALKDDPKFPSSIRENKQMLSLLELAEKSEQLICEEYKNDDSKYRKRYRLTERALKFISIGEHTTKNEQLSLQ